MTRAKETASKAAKKSRGAKKTAAKKSTKKTTKKKLAAKPSARDSQEAAQIGRWIQRLRSERSDGGRSKGGLGQNRPHVARAVGVSLATLQRWEKAVPVLWLQLRALAKTLGVTVDALLNPPEELA